MLFPGLDGVQPSLILTVILFLYLGMQTAYAGPIAVTSLSIRETSATLYPRAIQNKVMRIMPLGDSITVGYPGNPSNGYRKRLSSLLSGNGNTVNFVGSHPDGDFTNNRNEGQSGAKISTISTNADKTLPQRPNIVLLLAGTNDLGVTTNAPQQLDDLIGKIRQQCPDAAILVSTLIHRGDPSYNSQAVTFNNQLQGLVQTRRNSGQHVFLVDQYTAITTDLLVNDGIHPNPTGYDKMADVWNTALQQVDSLGWIGTPVPGTGGPSTKQPCTGKLFWNPFGPLLNGAGLGKDFYPNENNAHAVTFADLNGDGRDDYIWIGPNGEITAYVNGGLAADGHWIWYPQPNKIASGVGGKRGEIQFADLNGDGRAEYLWVHPDGSVDVWLNEQLPAETASTLAINWYPQTRSAKGIGRDGAGVRFADLNGDGRAEYLYVESNGAVIVYLNAGSQDAGPNAGVITWVPQKQTATGVGGVRNETVLADMDGDGRSDYLHVSRTNGRVDETKNGGSQDPGPNAGVINWVGVANNPIANGAGTTGRGVIFGDINGDGRAEFLDVNPDTSAVTMWLNGCDTS
ncbi:MAG: hypothetical protein Q9220_005641 [cf. Caloplaca sp. 1 TL-2023]